MLSAIGDGRKRDAVTLVLQLVLFNWFDILSAPVNFKGGASE